MEKDGLLCVPVSKRRNPLPKSKHIKHYHAHSLEPCTSELKPLLSEYRIREDIHYSTEVGLHNEVLLTEFNLCRIQNFRSRMEQVKKADMGMASRIQNTCLPGNPQQPL
jgi:hypothetical protein